MTEAERHKLMLDLLRDRPFASVRDLQAVVDASQLFLGVGEVDAEEMEIFVFSPDETPFVVELRNAEAALYQDRRTILTPLAKTTAKENSP